MNGIGQEYRVGGHESDSYVKSSQGSMGDRIVTLELKSNIISRIMNFVFGCFTDWFKPEIVKIDYSSDITRNYRTNSTPANKMKALIAFFDANKNYEDFSTDAACVLTQRMSSSEYKEVMSVYNNAIQERARGQNPLPEALTTKNFYA